MQSGAIDLRPSQRLAAVFNSFSENQHHGQSVERSLLSEILRFAQRGGSDQSPASVAAAIERLTRGSIRLAFTEVGCNWIGEPATSSLIESSYLPLRVYRSELSRGRKVPTSGKVKARAEPVFSVGVVVAVQRSAPSINKRIGDVSSDDEKIDYIGLAPFEKPPTMTKGCPREVSQHASVKVSLWLALVTGPRDRNAHPVELGDVVLFVQTAEQRACQEHAQCALKGPSGCRRDEPMVHKPVVCFLGRCHDAVLCPGLDQHIDSQGPKPATHCERIFDRRLFPQTSAGMRCRSCTKRLYDASSRTRRPELNPGIVPRASVFPRRFCQRTFVGSVSARTEAPKHRPTGDHWVAKLC